MPVALEFPGLLENLFGRFFAIIQGHPGVGVPVRTSEPYGKISWHERLLKILVETVLCEEVYLTCRKFTCTGGKALVDEFSDAISGCISNAGDGDIEVVSVITLPEGPS